MLSYVTFHKEPVLAGELDSIIFRGLFKSLFSVFTTLILDEVKVWYCLKKILCVGGAVSSANSVM